MRKIPCLLLVSMVLTIAFLSGCEQKGTEVENSSKLITLDSKVVELAYSSLNFTEDNSGKVVRADVEYLFKNVADRAVKVEVFLKFYDENNNLLATVGSKEINIPKGEIEQSISPANIISYDGKDAAKVDHVTIVANERL